MGGGASVRDGVGGPSGPAPAFWRRQYTAHAHAQPHAVRAGRGGAPPPFRRPAAARSCARAPMCSRRPEGLSGHGTSGQGRLGPRRGLVYSALPPFTPDRAADRSAGPREAGRPGVETRPGAAPGTARMSRRAQPRGQGARRRRSLLRCCAAVLLQPGPPPPCPPQAWHSGCRRCAEPPPAAAVRRRRRPHGQGSGPLRGGW